MIQLLFHKNKNSYHIPSHDQKRIPAVPITFSYIQTSNWFSTWNWTCTAEPEPVLHDPLLWFGHCCVQLRDVDVLLMFSCGREGGDEGKWNISYWSSTRRMGVLYNVDRSVMYSGAKMMAVSYYSCFMTWLYLWWITAIYSELCLVCVIVKKSKGIILALFF